MIRAYPFHEGKRDEAIPLAGREANEIGELRNGSEDLTSQISDLQEPLVPGRADQLDQKGAALRAGLVHGQIGRKPDRARRDPEGERTDADPLRVLEDPDLISRPAKRVLLLRGEARQNETAVVVAHPGHGLIERDSGRSGSRHLLDQTELQVMVRRRVGRRGQTQVREGKQDQREADRPPAEGREDARGGPATWIGRHGVLYTSKTVICKQKAGESLKRGC